MQNVQLSLRRIETTEIQNTDDYPIKMGQLVFANSGDTYNVYLDDDERKPISLINNLNKQSRYGGINAYIGDFTSNNDLRNYFINNNNACANLIFDGAKNLKLNDLSINKNSFIDYNLIFNLVNNKIYYNSNTYYNKIFGAYNEIAASTLYYNNIIGDFNKINNTYNESDTLKSQIYCVNILGYNNDLRNLIVQSSGFNILGNNNTFQGNGNNSDRINIIGDYNTIYYNINVGFQGSATLIGVNGKLMLNNNSSYSCGTAFLNNNAQLNIYNQAYGYLVNAINGTNTIASYGNAFLVNACNNSNIFSYDGSANIFNLNNGSIGVGKLDNDNQSYSVYGRIDTNIFNVCQGSIKGETDTSSINLEGNLININNSNLSLSYLYSNIITAYQSSPYLNFGTGNIIVLNQGNILLKNAYDYSNVIYGYSGFIFNNAIETGYSSNHVINSIRGASFTLKCKNLYNNDIGGHSGTFVNYSDTYSSKIMICNSSITTYNSIYLGNINTYSHDMTNLGYINNSIINNYYGNGTKGFSYYNSIVVTGNSNFNSLSLENLNDYETWSEDITYNVNDIIKYNNYLYTCKANNTGKIPPLNSTYWETDYKKIKGSLIIGNNLNINDNISNGLIVGNKFTILDGCECGGSRYLLGYNDTTEVVITPENYFLLTYLGNKLFNIDSTGNMYIKGKNQATTIQDWENEGVEEEDRKQYKLREMVLVNNKIYISQVDDNVADLNDTNSWKEISDSSSGGGDINWDWRI